MSYENCSCAIYDGDGKFDIPMILPENDVNVSEWIMFENARASVDKQHQNIGVHFFQDDHKFEIVWSQPRKHLNKLKSFGCVLSPDFSMYTDFPVAVQVMQQYKKHWVARFWQEEGINVVPTICWSTRESYDWCFDGEPRNSVVAVSNIGCSRKLETRKLFDDGYDEMISRLNPSKILFFTYERNPMGYKGNVEYINIKNIKKFGRNLEPKGRTAIPQVEE